MNVLRSSESRALPVGMFIYGCATAIAALVWLVWAGLRGGFVIERGDGRLAAVVFALCMAPHTPLFGRAENYEPLFQFTKTRITFVRILLLLCFVNIFFWPLFVDRLFPLVLPSMALCSALFSALRWGLGVSNILPPSFLRLRATPSLARIARPALRELQRAPEVSFEEWSSGIAKLAQLISSESSLRQDWVEGNQSATTIADYVELHAEIFVQLESERCLKAYSARLGKEKLSAIKRFLDATHRFDEKFNEKPSLRDPRVLLSSAEWGRVRSAAAKLSAIAS
jgi:hypothetical protein